MSKMEGFIYIYMDWCRGGEGFKQGVVWLHAMNEGRLGRVAGVGKGNI